MEINSVIPTVSLLLVTLGFFTTLRQFKLNKTFEFIKRFNEPSFVKVRASIDSWIEKDEEERIKMYENDKELAANVIAFINLFTELGIAVREGVVNIPVTYRLWDPAVEIYWKKLEPHIKERRKKGISIGHNFESLYLSLKSYRKSKIKKFLYKLRMGI